jgi:hypothetical protein
MSTQTTTTEAASGAEGVKAPPITILYTNWRGETAVRRIRLDFIAYGNEALGFAWGSNEWHPEEQMLLSALDVNKGERRTFALSGIKAWGEEAVRNAGWAARGEPDPHGDRYDRPREDLCGGHLTDDQVAFKVAALRRHDVDHEAVLATARDRIRWLSRRLAALTTGAAR